MQVVILAGGLGTKLRPLILTVPKPMVPIHLVMAGGGTDLTHVAAGAYLFRKQIMERIPAGVASSLEADLTPDLVGSNDLDAYLVDRPFYDIGTFERLALAGCALPHPSESV
ncbi:MAG: hypothetical protein E8D45_09740 [Nitrospira sp.]|nr:MAG: hypothetical protein E8D45_09740 [Nitrospira sp.]